MRYKLKQLTFYASDVRAGFNISRLAINVIDFGI